MLTEEQIIRVLQEHESGAEVAELLRRHNISRETFYRWKRKFGGMGVSEAQRLKQLEAENARTNSISAKPRPKSIVSPCEVEFEEFRDRAA